MWAPEMSFLEERGCLSRWVSGGEGRGMIVPWAWLPGVASRDDY